MCAKHKFKICIEKKNMWEALNRSEVKSKKFPLKIMSDSKS